MRSDQETAPAVLGGGYSTLMQTNRMACYSPGTTYSASGSKAVLGLSDNTAFSDIENQLHVNVEAHGGIGAFSGHASADYLRNTRDTRYSQSFYYKDAITFPMQYFMPSAYGKSGLTPMGQSALAGGPEMFNALCGDQFIQGIVPGANLIITLKLNFDTTTDKSTFTSSAGGSMGLNGASASIQKIVNEKHIKGSLSVLAYQEGGDPTQLANIFSRKDANGHYYVMTCSLDNLDSCTSTIDGFIDYAQSDFPEQLNFKDGKLVGSAYPTDFHYENYSTFGIDAGKSPTSPEIVAARNKLGELQRETQEDLDFVNHYMNSMMGEYLAPDTQSTLKSIAKSLNDNRTVINDPNDGAIQCYLNPTQCAVIEQNIESELAPIDEDKINYLRNNSWELVNGSGERYYPTDFVHHYKEYDVVEKKMVLGQWSMVQSADQQYLTVNGDTNPHGSRISTITKAPGLALHGSGVYVGEVDVTVSGKGTEKAIYDFLKVANEL